MRGRNAALALALIAAAAHPGGSARMGEMEPAKTPPVPDWKRCEDIPPPIYGDTRQDRRRRAREGSSR
jgi:hypothetical protein